MLQHQTNEGLDEQPYFSPNDFHEVALEQRSRGRLMLAQMLEFAAAELQELRTMRCQQGWGGEG